MRTREPRGRAAAIVVLTAFVAGTAWSARTAVEGLGASVVDGAAALSAALLCAAAATRAGNRRARIAWSSQATACGAWALAPLGWTLATSASVEYAAAGRLTADVGRLVFLVCAATGLWLTSRAASNRATVRLLLDGVVGASAALIVAWSLVFQRGHDSPGFTGPVAYLLGSLLVMVFGALLGLTEFRPGRRQMPALFAAGLAVISLGDLRYAELGGLAAPLTAVDTGAWLVGFGLIGAAACSYRGTTRRKTVLSTARWAAYAPYLLIVPAGAATLTQLTAHRPLAPPQLAAWWAIVWIILFRQLLLLAENRTLVDRLAARERELHHQALHDPLTGLGNRTLLIDRLDTAVTRQQTEARSFALLLCDLDDFKAVNDTLGHAAGDELLVQVASRLRAAARAGDTVVRLGGDEFAVVTDRDASDALTDGQRIWACFQTPFDVEGYQLPVRASIGVARVAAGATPLSAGELLRSADVAMYEAKRRGKNDVEVFDAGPVAVASGDLEPRLARRRP